MLTRRNSHASWFLEIEERITLYSSAVDRNKPQLMVAGAVHVKEAITALCRLCISLYY